MGVRGFPARMAVREPFGIYQNAVALALGALVHHLEP